MNNQNVSTKRPASLAGAVGIAGVVIVVLALAALLAIMFGLDVGTVFN